VALKRKNGLSIFVKILAVFLCVNIATSGILIVIAFGFHRNSIENRTKETVAQQLEILRDNFENDYRRNLKRSLEALVSSSILDDYLAVSIFQKKILGKKIEQQFLQTIKAHPTYHSIRFVDADGKIHISVVGKLRRKEAANLKNFEPTVLPPLSTSLGSSAKLFQRLESIPLLLSGGYLEWFMPPRELQVEGPFVDESGTFSLLAGVSKLDLDIGAFGGVLMIHQKLDGFLDGLHDVKFFDENLIWVYGANGLTLKIPAKEEYRLNPTRFISQELQITPKLIKIKEGLVAYQDFSIIPGKPFVRVVISIPNAILLKDFSTAIRFFTLVLVCSLILVLLLALYISRYLSKPIIQLAQAANRMAEGELTGNVQIETTGEVKILVDSFNQMTEELQQKTALLNVRLEEASKRKEDLERINLELEGAKKTLAEREQRYRMLTGNLPGVVYRVDLKSKNKPQFFNDMLLPMTGYTDKELKSTGLCVLNAMMLPTDRDAAIAKIENAISEKSLFEIEYRIKHKKGRIKYFLERGRPIYGSSGEPQCIDGVILDVTESEAAANEKKMLEAQLQRALKMEAVGTLAGGVAHDLNNILSGIVSYPELILLDLDADSPLREPIETIQNSGKRAAEIVQDLLTLARRGVTVKDVVNLNECVRDYLESPEFRSLKSFNTTFELDVDLDVNLLNMSGSKVHLTKTIMNLVSNATEAMPAGGRLYISTENKYIDRPIIGYDDVDEGDYTVLTVSDSGTGISPKDIDRVFEPFYTTKEMGKSGTGLGMAVVWGTVKDHNGYVNVESVLGKGTTFKLYFPVTREEKVDAASIHLKSYSGNKESILIVDDSKTQRDISSSMLKRLDYSVSTVSSGEEAVQYLKDKSVDLVILDMIMDPGIDGLDTYKKIISIHPRQKAIIASGYSETDRIKEAQRLGAGTYVKKPYTLENIGLAVKAELGKQIEPILKK
jgi:PAS domain S-box-containing protein